MSRMDTPVADFCRAYAQAGWSRLHVPGHKGRGPLGCEALDLTEVEGADELYDAQGILARSEANAARLFGARQTFYSAEGSSHAIRAMLFLAMQAAGGRRVVLAARNVHKVFLYACALLDLEPQWLLPERACPPCSCPVSPAGLEARLSACAELPAAVYVTSPDYLGGMQDLAGLAAVCRRYGVPLLVDNAHGAYLHFLPQPQHPLDLGAAMCCDSAHKTLPVLTGGAYLHIGAAFPALEAWQARRALALFGSTSPSYLILQSLDLCNRALAEDYPARAARCAADVARLRAALRRRGVCVAESEPFKLVLDAAGCGTTGAELAARLRAGGVVCEYADRQHVVLMCSPDNDARDFARVEAALADFVPGPPCAAPLAPVQLPPQACSVRQAIFAPHERVPLRAALGRTCAAPVVSCPPAVPLVMSGECVTEEVICALEENGVQVLEVCL